MAGPPVEVQVRVNVAAVAFSSDVSWNWREVMLGTPGECERRLKAVTQQSISTYLLTCTGRINSNIKSVDDVLTWYVAVVDSNHSTCPAVHTNHTRTSAGVELPRIIKIWDFSFIGKVPFPNGTMVTTVGLICKAEE